jgi:hypothetical protein
MILLKLGIEKHNGLTNSMNNMNNPIIICHSDYFGHKYLYIHYYLIGNY